MLILRKEAMEDGLYALSVRDSDEILYRPGRLSEVQRCGEEGERKRREGEREVKVGEEVKR